MLVSVFMIIFGGVLMMILCDVWIVIVIKLVIMICYVDLLYCYDFVFF